MKNNFTLFILICGLFSSLNAQTVLDPNQFVNDQITGDGVYIVEPGNFYAFDGQLNLTYDVTIQGPDSTWIMEHEAPPVIVQTPGNDGARRQFMQIDEGGKFTMKNLILSGIHNNGEIGRVFINNAAGKGLIVDNCVITDWEDFALRNQSGDAEELSITNCVFINGARLRYSQWGGFPLRLDVGVENVIYENNTVYNCGRLMANAGPFLNSNIYQNHNTIINQIVAGEEHRGYEMTQANNIFYNYHFIGYATESHSNPSDEYATYWTGLNAFSPLEDNLDSVSTYVGQNLFYRPTEIVEWFESSSGDSVDLSLLWEFPAVDSFILADDNYKIGANYAEINPEFTNLVDVTPKILEYINAHYNDQSQEWPDFRIESPVTFNTDGTPQLSWPPAFDLSYSNEFLQTAGSDGLPLGDLNWFPEQKEQYEENRDAYIDGLRDSMTNAQVYYDPLTMDETPLITDGDVTTALEQIDPNKLFLDGNFPNPFGDVTTVRFGVKQRSNVTFGVYNMVGQKVYESTKDLLAPGAYEFKFDGSNHAPGVYLYKINAIDSKGQNYVGMKKMIISR